MGQQATDEPDSSFCQFPNPGALRTGAHLTLAAALAVKDRRRELSGEARDKNLKEWRQNDCGAEPPKEGGGNIFLEQLGIKHTKTEE